MPPIIQFILGIGLFIYLIVITVKYVCGSDRATERRDEWRG